MQNKTKIQDKSIWRTVFRVGQWLLPVLLCIVLYQKFFRNHTFSLEHFFHQLRQLSFSWYLLLIACALINWFLETVKWRILLNPVNPLTFRKAFTSVLAGVAVSQLLPYRTGEYIGRLLHVREDNRISAAMLSVIGSYSQLLVTLAFGIAGFMIIQPVPYAGYFLWTVVLIMVVGFMVYFLLPGLTSATRFAFVRKLIEAFGFITRKELMRILGISLIRYFSFLLPYALLSWHFSLGNNTAFTFHVFAVGCIFFIQTIAPNFILTDIALRLTIPALVFSGNDASASQMDYVPGMVVYLFNVTVPMIAGAFIIMTAKFNQS